MSATVLGTMSIGFGVAAAAGIFITLRIISKRQTLKRLFDLRTLAIELPPAEKIESAEMLVREIGKTADLLTALTSVKIPLAFEVAVPSVGRVIRFYISAPEGALEFVTNQIHGLWPAARVSRTSEYTIFSPGAAVGGAYVLSKEDFALPILTFREGGSDSLPAVLNALAGASGEGEGGAVQIMVRPAENKIKERLKKTLYGLRKGAKLGEATEAGKLKLSEFSGILGTSKPKAKLEVNQASVVVDETAVRLVGEKIASPLFRANIRLLASALVPMRADIILDGITSSFSKFGAPARNSLQVVKPKNLRDLIFRFTMREFDDKTSIVLNADELATVFHLPIGNEGAPNVAWLKAREAPPPADLPTSGVFLGESSFRGEHRSVYLDDEDRRRHLYAVGQTGTGKSTLMTNMAVHDIESGKGIAVIDPHGDLVERLLTLIPESRRNDVVLFDPGDRVAPIGMNMLEWNHDRPEEKTFIVNELFSILDKLYDMKTVGGPMFEQYTKNAILLLLEDESEPATLLEIPRLFTDQAFRAKKLGRAKNPTVVDFWEKEAAKASGEHSLANMAPYITSKFNSFIANDYVRPIIGQPASSVRFRELMDQGKILLVNLSKGRIGELNANLLGMVIVGKMLMAALSRVDTPRMEDRRDFNLYIDEFQNFTTESIATILSEARKYRLNLTVAHQFIGQLDEKIRAAVFGNIGSIVSFRVGTEDAEFLAQQFGPVVSKNDLMQLDNFNCYARLLMNGSPQKPFNIHTSPEKRGENAAAEAIRNYSRTRYGQDRNQVEKEILARLRS